MAVCFLTLAVFLSFAALAAALFAERRARRLEKTVEKLKLAIVSSVMEESPMVEALRVEQVMNSYRQLLADAHHVNERWAMEEARKLWGLK